MRGKLTLEQKWHQQSEAAKSAAEKLPQGKERERWVEQLRCPNCGKTGTPRLSQADGWTVHVDTALPATAQRNSDDDPTGKRTVRGAYCRHVRVGSQVL